MSIAISIVLLLNLIVAGCLAVLWSGLEMLLRFDRQTPLILGRLARRSADGKALKRYLKRRGEPAKLAEFYRLMYQLEEKGLVTSWREKQLICGHEVHRRVYRRI